MIIFNWKCCSGSQIHKIHMIARIALKTLIYETEFGHYNQCIEKTFNI